ncbi:hypothetical protein [Nocardioides bruguierae]|uniref:AsnC family protein n=1 Tax=Nocardioides bruguierae TaxID=2945102 RepID=A0A9X2D697_9ACTN|nr:hypothetical protein [Nocardioides bruguierae]MCM0619804.1 hypothetical protein [Nocardioides bruguierae]
MTAPRAVMASISDAQIDLEDARNVLLQRVAAARSAGAAWAAIGDELGVTRQSAHERFARQVRELE